MSKLKQRLKANFVFIAIGLTIAGKGLSFMLARQFFTWPPQYSWLLNDARIDIFALIAGLGLVVYSLSSSHNRQLQGVLLGCCTAYICFITIMEVCHIIFVGQTRLLTTVVGNLFFIAIILYTARTQHKL